MKHPFLLVPLLSLCLAPAARSEPFSLKDGDRVVLLGSTLIEREQRYGYWESALLAHFPGKKVTVRNLGWSGDTVFGEARAGFGTVADGFKHLKEHTLALKPTVLIIGYGTNESFAGPAGLPRFLKGLQALLSALQPAEARVVLLSPLRQGDMGPPLPSPDAQNRNLRLYSDAIRDEAKKGGYAFVDLYDLLGDIGKVKGASENGLHLTAEGYRWSAPLLLKGLGISPTPWRVEVDVSAGKALEEQGARVEYPAREKARSPREFFVTDKQLPAGPRTLVAKGLPAGKFSLQINGKEVATASAEGWARGVPFASGPDFEQAEKLRRAIVAKNELYFHRWRPQNETYLFGFRKHEQGKNAREIPQFDPLVEAREKEILELTRPHQRVYFLTPVLD